MNVVGWAACFGILCAMWLTDNKNRLGFVVMETHFAYQVEGFANRDIATKTFNLSGTTVEQRRALIHSLIENHGECLAKLPCRFGMTEKVNLGKLTAFLNGEPA